MHTSPQILKKRGQFLSFFCQWCGFRTEARGSLLLCPSCGEATISILLRNGTPFFCFPEEKREGEARLRPVTCAGSGGFHFGRRNVAPEETVVVVVVPFIAFRVGLIAPTPSSARCVIVVACLRPSSPRPSACIGSPEPVGRRCYKYVTRSRR